LFAHLAVRFVSADNRVSNYSAASGLLSLRRKFRRAQTAISSMVAFVSGRKGKAGYLSLRPDARPQIFAKYRF
jgi:hypothetical protein